MAAGALAAFRMISSELFKQKENYWGGGGEKGSGSWQWKKTWLDAVATVMQESGTESPCSIPSLNSRLVTIKHQKSLEADRPYYTSLPHAVSSCWKKMLPISSFLPLRLTGKLE